MAKTEHTGPDLEIRADFAQAACLIEYRAAGAEDWQPTPYQVADAGHDPARALQLVSEWADMQA